MTTKEKLIQMCVERGMFDDQAKKVIELAIPKINDQKTDYKISWDRPATEYPDVFYNVIFLTVANVATEWIKKNIPQAWFLPMFDVEHPLRKNNKLPADNIDEEV